MTEYDAAGVAITAGPKALQAPGAAVDTDEIHAPRRVIITGVRIPFDALVNLVAKVLVAIVLALLIFSAAIAGIAFFVLIALK